MARPNAKLEAAYDDYVCVRITDMQHVDTNLFPLDFGLTFNLVLMNADGTIYHRFGGRDWKSADGYLSEPTLLALLKTTRAEHQVYQKNPAPPAAKPVLRFNDWPENKAWRRSLPDDKQRCNHCHQIGTFRRERALKNKTWSRATIYRFPMPARVGITLDPKVQTKVSRVAPGSAADKADLKPGDLIERVGEVSVATLSDFQWALDQTAGTAGTLAIRYRRGDAVRSATLRLAANWKRAKPLTVSWRPLIWAMTPKPGFLGPALEARARKWLKLPPEQFAFRIRYLVTWDEDAYTGLNAQRAGLRKADVILSTDGKSDFQSFDHWNAWFRLTRTVGKDVTFEVARNRRRLKITMPVLK